LVAKTSKIDLTLLKLKKECQNKISIQSKDNRTVSPPGSQSRQTEIDIENLTIN
jgi:hypothetical protein